MRSNTPYSEEDHFPSIFRIQFYLHTLRIKELNGRSFDSTYLAEIKEYKELKKLTYPNEFENVDIRPGIQLSIPEEMMRTTPAPDASIAPARSLGRTFKSSSRVGSSSARVRAIWASNRSLMSRPGAPSGKRFTVSISPSHRSDSFDHTVQLLNGQCSSGLSEKRGDKDGGFRHKDFTTYHRTPHSIRTYWCS
jgi:hypothetical protein